MKKIYEKPAICVVKIRYQNHLLVNSQQQIHSEFVNGYYYEDWDSDGGQYSGKLFTANLPRSRGRETFIRGRS